MSDISTVTTSSSVSPISRPSRRSMSATPPGSSRLSVSPCSSRSTIAWWSMRRRFSEPVVPADAPCDSFRNRSSTASATAAGVVCCDAAIALIGRPSATIFRSASSPSLSPPSVLTGRTSASTIVGSSTEPPVATSRTARASWSPSAIRSLSR